MNVWRKFCIHDHVTVCVNHSYCCSSNHIKNFKLTQSIQFAGIWQKGGASILRDVRNKRIILSNCQNPQLCECFFLNLSVTMLINGNIVHSSFSSNTALLLLKQMVGRQSSLTLIEEVIIRWSVSHCRPTRNRINFWHRLVEEWIGFMMSDNCIGRGSKIGTGGGCIY
jgi:hypothetical protein